MKKGTKVALIVLGTIAGLLLALVIAIACVWGKEISTLCTVKAVDGNKYIYQMEYKADYDLDELISKDIDSNAKLIEYAVARIGKGLPINMKSSQVVEEEEENADHCTSFSAKNAEGEGYFFGRNYDYFKNPSLVCYSYPKNGYASIGVSDMSHFGYSLDKLPESFLSKVLCLAAIYAPVDGINEKGLCTSIMALPKQASQQDTGKHKVGTAIIMRLFLDRCATVQEAIDLAESLDIRHDVTVGTGYHYLVADANGDCAVIEFDKDDGWKTMIVRKPEDANYMHVTNHLLSEKYYTTTPDPAVGNVNSHSWWRYETVANYMNERNGIVTREEAQECLSNVHWVDLVWPDGMIEDTQYSNVYDQTECVLYLRSWSDYETTHVFPLAK